MRFAQRSSSAGELVVWAVAAALFPFVAPLVAVFLLHQGFVAIIVAMVWVVVACAVIAYVGLAWILEGGRMRRIGAAIIFGEALGILLFAACVYVAFHHATTGSA